MFLNVPGTLTSPFLSFLDPLTATSSVQIASVTQSDIEEVAPESSLTLTLSDNEIKIETK